ncbi:peptidase S10 [Zeaxanthinibacter sp. PT1]|uniref:S10 family peptidase n=1 Tax=Zeaxanthinibacter TaxID=561554 RepID=UPI00234A9F3F|nr:peptidase S10 [Zeaxanthinibacter sp. PT1]MDC6350908.1 peptidase S10 [Zeaxanthinibacter sp. PT1]
MNTLFKTCLVFFVSVTVINAQQKTSDSIPEPQRFVTQHQLTNGGKTIAYTATASETHLKNKKGEPTAALWSVAYTKTGSGDSANRPVTFVFNGGPGSASVWLHMGMFGPKRVRVPSDADKDDGAAPYPVETNSAGIFDLTDLVFIDPVGTGYSRVIGKGKEEDYWGLMEDANSIAQFMRSWITENNRWMSPKYIAGESFGTTRAAAVANVLEEDGQSMALNGLILISQALDYAGSTSVHNNITSYLTYLPSMAATAWYHKKAGQGKSLEDFVQEAREFTYDTYAPALYKGSLLVGSEREQLAERLSYFTGLDKQYIIKSNLRILVPRFQKKLLEENGKAVGRLDGRFMGPEIDLVDDAPHLGDPASYQIGDAYTAALNHYLATDLKVKMDRPYLTSNSELGGKWRWRPVPDGKYWEPMPVNTATMLAETMQRNQDLKILVANGYYDLICPFFDAEYTFSRHGIDRDRVDMKYYQAGHMMYTHEEDFTKLSEDIRLFFTD